MTNLRSLESPYKKDFVMLYVSCANHFRWKGSLLLKYQSNDLSIPKKALKATRFQSNPLTYV